MKRLFFVFLISMFVIVPLVFSGGRSGASVASGPITYYCSTDIETFNSAAVNTFNNKQNEIKVELVTIPNSDVETKIKTLLAGGGSEIDVFDINGVALANSYGINGATQDLRDYLNKTTLNLNNYGGKIRFATLENGTVAAMPRSWGG
jgi:ABC-type glycerol-3-phosphate transport system substrate-binding protein